MIPRCVIIGGGGHARVVIEALRISRAGEPHAIIDLDAARHGLQIDGVKILGGNESVAQLRAAGISHFVMGFAGTGDNQPRRHAFEEALAWGFQPLTLVHPSAVVASTAVLAEGVQIHAQAVVNSGAVLGSNVIVNTGAIVEHDCVVASHVHLAIRACLSGGVRVEEGAFLGAGCVVRQGLTIGAGAVVGAGAAVVKNVESDTVVVGVPARPLSRC